MPPVPEMSKLSMRILICWFLESPLLRRMKPPSSAKRITSGHCSVVPPVGLRAEIAVNTCFSTPMSTLFSVIAKLLDPFSEPIISFVVCPVAVRSTSTSRFPVTELSRDTLGARLAKFNWLMTSCVLSTASSLRPSTRMLPAMLPSKVATGCSSISSTPSSTLVKKLMPVNSRSFATTDSMAIEPKTLNELSSSIGIAVFVAGEDVAITTSLGSIAVVSLLAAVVAPVATSESKKGKISI